MLVRQLAAHSAAITSIHVDLNLNLKLVPCSVELNFPSDSGPRGELLFFCRILFPGQLEVFSFQSTEPKDHFQVILDSVFAHFMGIRYTFSFDEHSNWLKLIF